MLAHLQCEYPAAVRRLEGALALYRELGDRRGRRRDSVSRWAASPGSRAGTPAPGNCRRRPSPSSRRSVTAVAWPAPATRSVSPRGWRATSRPRRPNAPRRWSAFTELGDAEGAAGAELNLGVAAMYRGEHEAAATALARSRELSEQVGFREGVAWALHERGLLAVRHGEPGAAALLQEALDIHRDLGDRWRVTSVLDDLAAAALAGQPPDAGRGGTAARGGAAHQGGDRHRHRALRARGPRQDRGGGAGGARRRRLRRPRPGRRRRAAGRRAGRPRPASAALPPDAGAAAVTHLDSSAKRTATADHRPQGEPRSVAEAGAGDQAGPPPAPADRPPGDTLRLRLLGQATVHLAGRLLTPADWGYAKPRELLCLFASSPPLAREQVGLALWPELAEGQLRNALHSALRQLRRTLGDGGWIGFADGRYALDESRPLDCDLRDFEQALAAARAAQPPAAALPHLRPCDRGLRRRLPGRQHRRGLGRHPARRAAPGLRARARRGGPPAGGRRPGARGDRRVPAGDRARTAGRGGTPRADGVLGRGRPACPRDAPLRGTPRTAARRRSAVPRRRRRRRSTRACATPPADPPPPADPRRARIDARASVRLGIRAHPPAFPTAPPAIPTQVPRSVPGCPGWLPAENMPLPPISMASRVRRPAAVPRTSHRGHRSGSMAKAPATEPQGPQDSGGPGVAPGTTRPGTAGPGAAPGITRVGRRDGRGG